MRALSIATVLIASFMFSMAPMTLNASFYDGGGLEEGIEKAEEFETGGTGDARETLKNILFGIISFMGIIAVLVIVIAGIILMVGGSDEQQRQKAWKMVLYAIIGLIVILLAGAIVGITVGVFS